jgi:hypothetical protein
MIGGDPRVTRRFGAADRIQTAWHVPVGRGPCYRSVIR